MIFDWIQRQQLIKYFMHIPERMKYKFGVIFCVIECQRNVDSIGQAIAIEEIEIKSRNI